MLFRSKELDLGFYVKKDYEDDKWFRAEFSTRINPDNQNINPDYRLMLGFGTSF